MGRYWSCFERDQLFGAIHDAYSCKWTGYSVANPEYDAKEMYKAVSWAVHSAKLAEHPTMTVFILPAWTESSNTAYMKWVCKMPDTCRLLATLPRKQFKFIPPQATTLGIDSDDVGNPKWDVNILLVGNQAGYDGCFNPDPQVTTASLKRNLIQAINELLNLSTPLTWARTQHHWPMEGHPDVSLEEELDAILYKPPNKVTAAPSDQLCSWHLEPPPSEPERERQEHTNSLDFAQQPLRYDWTELVYTDGSQQKVVVGPEDKEVTVLGSALYVPATQGAAEQRIGINATSTGRHNTAYRAELIGILGAFRQGHHKVMTDNVNSIHAIQAALFYPAKIRYHRHRNILEEIKAALLALDGEAMLIKVRSCGHTWE
jgi:hypothetical protein